jgi:hypothetical protein
MNQTASIKFSYLWLYCTVFLTGATVMVIELLGTRLIAPFYSASLYVWASLISVTMIALAGLLTLIIPWMVGPVLLATDSLGLRLGTFISTLILFTPSLIMLGMVTPFAVKLATSSLQGISPGFIVHYHKKQGKEIKADSAAYSR